MANTVADGTTKQHWMANFQPTLESALVSFKICKTHTGPDRIIHNPYQSEPTGQDGAASVDYSGNIDDFTLTDDTLTVNRRAYQAEHVDNIEQLQVRYDLAKARAERHAYVVRKKIDAYVLQNAATTSGTLQVDDGEIGGTDGNPITLSSTNVDDMLRAVMETLYTNDARMENGVYIVLAPDHITKLTQFQQANGFSLADAALKNGYIDSYMGVDIYLSNQLYNDGTQDHAIAGVYDSISLALPDDGGDFEKKAVSGKFGRELVTSKIYNTKIWNNMLKEVVDIFVN
jgi:hypothetical protein